MDFHFSGIHSRIRGSVAQWHDCCNTRNTTMHVNCTRGTNLYISRGEQLVCVILMCLFSILGAIINGFAMFVLLRLKSTLKKNPNKFLIPLVAGQLIITLIVAPYRIQQLLSTTCTQLIVKRYISSLIFISGVSKGCIAYDRYLHVELNHSYHNKMKGSLMYILLGLPWLATLIYLISLSFNKLEQFIIISIITLLLCWCLLYFYTKMITILRYQYKYMANVHVARAIRKMHNKKIIRVSVWILSIELCSCVPGIIHLFCGIVKYSSHLKLHFWTPNRVMFEAFVVICYLLSVCVNPMLYFNRNKDFKRYIWRVFKRRSEIHPLRNDVHPAKHSKSVPAKVRYIPRTPTNDEDEFKLSVYPSPKKNCDWLLNFDRNAR